MSLIDDILDDEKEFYLETEDKTRLFLFIYWFLSFISMLLILLIIHFIDIYGFYILLFGIAGIFAIVLFLLRFIHKPFYTMLISQTLGYSFIVLLEKYKKLKIDKDLIFIFVLKNNKTEKVLLNQLKNISITQRELVTPRSQETTWISTIKILTKNNKLYQITVSSLGGFPTDDELPCKIEYK